MDCLSLVRAVARAVPLTGCGSWSCLVVCLVPRRTVSRPSSWLWPWSTSSLCSWCPNTATYWSPKTTRRPRRAPSPPGAQVHQAPCQRPAIIRDLCLYASIWSETNFFPAHSYFGDLTDVWIQRKREDGVMFEKHVIEKKEKPTGRSAE